MAAARIVAPIQCREHAEAEPVARSPGLKFSTSTSDLAISSLNNSLPRAVFRLRVRLRLLALNSRKKRLSLSWSRMLRRALSPPFELDHVGAEKAEDLGAGRLWVMSMTRIPESAFSIPIFPD